MVGEIPLRMPRLGQGHEFPGLLEPRCKTEEALSAVIHVAYVKGVSTLKVDNVLNLARRKLGKFRGIGLSVCGFLVSKGSPPKCRVWLTIRASSGTHETRGFLIQHGLQRGKKLVGLQITSSDPPSARRIRTHIIKQLDLIPPFVAAGFAIHDLGSHPVREQSQGAQPELPGAALQDAHAGAALNGDHNLHSNSELWRPRIFRPILGLGSNHPYQKDCDQQAKDYSAPDPSKPCICWGMLNGRRQGIVHISIPSRPRGVSGLGGSQITWPPHSIWIHLIRSAYQNSRRASHPANNSREFKTQLARVRRGSPRAFTRRLRDEE